MSPENPLRSPPPEPLDTAPDEIVVQRAVDGDVRAFQIVLLRYASLLRAYVARIVGSVTEADDVVQETFVIAWRELPSLQEPRHVKAWLMKIASRRAFALLRKRPTDIPLPVGLPAARQGDPESAATHSAQLRDLARALDALPEDQRRCWLLREVGELSYQEIAAATGLTAAQVRGSLARARANITIRMEGWR